MTVLAIAMIVPANNGDRVSQYNIALLYFFGNGVKKNLEIAIYKIEKIK